LIIGRHSLRWPRAGRSRRQHPATFLLLVVALAGQTLAHAQDPLPSWNDGPAKQAILAFVKEVTDKSDPKYVAPEDRIATFDQDGTTWVEHPMYKCGKSIKSSDANNTPTNKPPKPNET